MFIHDLEFISSCSQELSQNGSDIRGGAAATASTYTSTTDSYVVAGAEASASGDYNRAQTTTGATIIDKDGYYYVDGYIAGYSTAYGAAYGVERYYTPVTAVSYSSSTL